MKTQTKTTNAVAARLGSSHGYRIDGDTVFLNASFNADTGADAGRTWSLRLVAGADALAGHVITEVALPPLSELTGAVENYETASAAHVPAARGEHPVTLALVARDAAGKIELHDAFTYALAETFAQPRLAGPVGFWFESDAELVLDIDRIENHRAPDNLSGTLSLEVWASDRAYDGGADLGQPVAGAILGSLAGGQSWTTGTLHLRAVKPAAGSHIHVALREWNGAAYVTRDYVNFAPAPVAAVVETAPVAAAPVSIVTKAVETVKTALAAVVTAATEPAKPAAAKETAKAKTSKAAAPAKAETPAAKVEKAEKPAAKTKKKTK